LKPVSERRTVFRVGPQDRGRRLDRFLHERIPGPSRAWIQRSIDARVTLSWTPRVRPSTRVRAGGEVRIAFTPLAERPLELRIPVLDRGPGWLAVDKPAGIPVHPVHRVRENTVVLMLRRQERIETLRLVHRLDRETSGALLLARDAATACALATAFGRREVAKEYLALVCGEIDREAGEIDLPLGPAPDSRVRQRVAPRADGKPSRTSWRVERRLRGRTLVRVFPRTGRRHQIRAHLAAIGHPILGDLLYGRDDGDFLEVVRGARDPRRDRDGPIRHLLHCARLVAPDPAGGGEITIDAPLPEDLRAAIDDRRRVL
jgi:RluA family pseudouridine synthase